MSYSSTTFILCPRLGVLDKGTTCDKLGIVVHVSRKIGYWVDAGHLHLPNKIIKKTIVRNIDWKREIIRKRVGRLRCHFVGIELSGVTLSLE